MAKRAAKENLLNKNRSLDDFFKQTTIHGLRFLGRGNSPFTKFVWVFITLSGICMTLFLLHILLSDWSSYPTYTTIDSSAVPVSEIPFPSVTVCKSDGDPIPSGGWGFIRNVLNAYKTTGVMNRNFYNLTAFGRKFERFVDFSGKMHLQKMLKYLNEDESINFDVGIPKMDPTLEIHTDAFMEKGLDFLCSEETNYNNAKSFLDDAPVNSIFGGSVEALLHDWSFNQTLHDNCTRDAKPILFASYYLLAESHYQRSLGTILSMFAQHFGSRSFMRTTWKTSGDDMDCDNMSEMEIELHDIFTQMSLDMGIGNVSLFELPMLLEGNGKPANIPPAWEERYPHFTCKANERPVSFFGIIFACDKAWLTHLLWTSGEEDEFYKVTEEPSHPCSVSPACCPARQVGHMNLTNVMKVMKFAARRGRSHFNREHLVSSLPTFDDHARSNPEHPVYGHPELDADVYSDIPYCLVDRSTGIGSYMSMAISYPKCEVFQPTVTSRGICYGFNSMQPSKLMTDSPFLTSMLEAYKHELSNESATMAFDGQNGHGLVFYLDKQKLLSTNQFGDVVADVGYFRVAINDILNAFNVKSQETKIRVGHHTEILVSVKELTVSEGVRSIPIEARNCRLSDEVPSQMKIFKQYSQKLCLFECALHVAKETCGCTPWNYPFGENQEQQICDHYGKYCFEYFFQNQKTGVSRCDCPPDCHRLSYSFTEKEWPLDPEEMCEPGLKMYSYVNAKMANWYHHEVFTSFLSLTKNGSVDTSFASHRRDAIKLCREMVKQDLAVVSVKMASGVFERSQIRLKQTFADKVSSFGGTLGLFVGASFISMAEICFWVGRLMLGVKRKHPKSKKNF